MTDPQPPPESASQRIDYTNPWVIAGGLVAFAILLLAVPIFWFFLPVVIGFMVFLYLASAGSLKKARARARNHLGPLGKTELEVELRLGMTSALVCNDWGIVFARFGRRPVEVAWKDIRLVDESAIALLKFYDYTGLAFQIDLSQDRYFLAIRTLDSKLPGKTNFDVDPVSGQSNLLRKLQRDPFRWQGKWGSFVLSEAGVENNLGSMSWQEIERVREFSFAGDESESYWELRFTSDQLLFDLRNTNFSDGRQVGNSGYDTIKAVVALRIPGKFTYDLPAPLPQQRAINEFNRCLEATKVGFSLALKSGKFSFFERYFQHMLFLVDTFSLEGVVDTQSFFRDYAELMSRTNRPEESAQLESRAQLSARGWRQ